MIGGDVIPMGYDNGRIADKTHGERPVFRNALYFERVAAVRIDAPIHFIPNDIQNFQAAAPDFRLNKPHGQGLFLKIQIDRYPCGRNDGIEYGETAAPVFRIVSTIRGIQIRPARFPTGVGASCKAG